MVSIILLISFICLFIGLLYPCLALFGHDVYSRRNKTLTLMIRWRKQKTDIWQNLYMNNILKMVAPIIPLSAIGEKRLEDRLLRADIPYTAKEYYAKAILSAVLGILVALWALAMESYLLVVGGLLMSVFLYFKNFDEVSDILKNKYSIIEQEIPGLVRSVAIDLRANRDVLRAIEKYNNVASPVMASELEPLLADMQSSSVQQALRRFDNRMSNAVISRFCAALIEVDRGVDATTMLSVLAEDMTKYRTEMITRELDKRPGQMKKTILPAGIILVIMMLYMLIATVVQQAQTIL